MSGCKELTFWCDQDARRNNENTGACLLVSLFSSKLPVRSKKLIHSLFDSWGLAINNIDVEYTKIITRYCVLRIVY